MNKPDKIQSLKHQIDEQMRASLEAQIKSIKDPFFESERVLVANSAQMIWDIARHVQNSQDIFVTADSHMFSPTLPKGIDYSFMAPQEITEGRERPYALDRDGILRELQVEVRQQRKGKKTVQTTKIGDGGSMTDSTMDRWEQKSVLNTGFGFNVYAIGDKKARQEVLDNLTSHPKLVQRLISQRIRIPYHPEGNPDIEIELALEPLHCGETFTGFVWKTHKIDIEIKKGPDHLEQALRHSILAREEERLMSIFPLQRQLTSSATPGFDAVMEDLRKSQHRLAFDRLGASDEWWKNDTRLTTLDVA